ARRLEIEKAAAVVRHNAENAQHRVEQLRMELTGFRQQIALELGPVDEISDTSTRLLVALPSGATREQTIEPSVEAERLRARTAALRARLRGLPSGTEFIVEYESTRQRVETLEAQSSDLRRTAATLASAIAEISDTVQRRFDATFSAVGARFAER